MDKRVLISGCFDIIHSGHIRMLERIAKFGLVIVNVVPDNRVREKKGENRPHFSAQERCFVLKHLKCVYDVVSIPADAGMTMAEYQVRFLSVLEPDIFISSYRLEQTQSYCRDHGIVYKYIHEIEGIDKKHSSDISHSIRTTKQESA